MKNNIDICEEIGKLLLKHKLVAGCVESATGGLISHYITSVPGSSDYFKGGITAYSNEIKIKLAGVSKKTLEEHGAVSSHVAEEMAAGGREALGVDICISDTGIAGPTGATMGKPLGLFYIGLATPDGNFNRKYQFKGKRLENTELAAMTALNWLKEYLTDYRKPKDEKLIYKINPVVTCFLQSHGKILLLRRSNEVRTYQGKWAAVSGYVEDTPDRQAYIEIAEETGLTVRDITLARKGKPLNYTDHDLRIKWEIHPYLFRADKTVVIKLDREHVEYKWIEPEKIDDYDTVPKLKEALSLVLKKE